MDDGWTVSYSFQQDFSHIRMMKKRLLGAMYKILSSADYKARNLLMEVGCPNTWACRFFLKGLEESQETKSTIEIQLNH